MRHFILLSTTLLLIMIVHLGGTGATKVVVVDSELRASVEDFLRTRSNFRMDDASPFKMKANRFPVQDGKQKRSRKLELAEEALGMIYHELFGMKNLTEFQMRSRGRQSFFSNGLHGAAEYVMQLVEHGLEELPSLPRLEAQECVKRSVCEAHSQPKKYGLIGLLLQLLFPPYTKTEDPSNVVSKYQLAARYGRQNNANCGIQYDGCMLNLLDIAQALVNAFVR